MAEARRPVSELYPLGGAVSLEWTLSGGSLFDTSTQSSTQTAAPSGPAGGPGYTCRGVPKEAVSELCMDPSAAGEPGGQEQSPSKQCVPSGASSCLRGVAEAPPPPQGAPSPAPGSDTHRLANHEGVKSIQEAESRSKLACKQPMQLQQCNIITTICRGANSGEGGVQLHQSRCPCSPSPKAATEAAGVKGKGPLPAKCDKAVCYGSYIHQANLEDTFAAYCHPQPIPAPSQLQPRLAGIEPDCDAQRAAAATSPMNHLTLPRLISSVSETGLDAKHLLRCCNLSCSWISTPPPGGGPQSQKHFGLEECCSSPIAHVRTTTRDMGTMTAHKELRDVGVQAGQAATPHVFPQIWLTEDNSRSETSCGRALNTDTDGGEKPGGAAPKSPVKEVKWDAEGMTWEVYGASVDPEELGLAIQRHLELQIRETASHAARLSRQNTNTSRQSGSLKGKRSRVMGSFRTPACCARSSTAVD